ncbi:MAG TPA: hypothetical protein VN886_05535 [Acidimicrobiales bacterium]|nr:hypothetical protein [Acidimicrobiales bacterium]
MTDKPQVSNAFIPAPVTTSIEPHVTRQCIAHNRRGTQCQRPAGPGGTTCRYHGYAAPQVANAARARIATNSALATIANQVHEPVEDPAFELLSIASEIVALKDELGRRASELQEIAVTDKLGGQNIAAVLSAYTGALKQASDVLVKIVKLDLADRRIRVAEADHRKLIQAVQGGVYAYQTDPPLSHEQKREILQSIADALDALYE